jgi:hypothetical protein
MRYDFPHEPSMRTSHEAIYQALYCRAAAPCAVNSPRACARGGRSVCRGRARVVVEDRSGIPRMQIRLTRVRTIVLMTLLLPFVATLRHDAPAVYRTKVALPSLTTIPLVSRSTKTKYALPTSNGTGGTASADPGTTP